MESTGTDARGGDMQLSIAQYYDSTWIDYRLLWLNNDNLAIHFGYHDQTPRSHSEGLENTNRVLANIADIQHGDRVLDAGCGVGSSSIWIATNRGAIVTGITPVQTQVDRASAAVIKRGLSAVVAVRRADYAATPFANESFDVVWALESLCHAQSKAAFYREAARLLCRRGRLVIGEYVRADRLLSAEDEHLLKQWLDGWMIPDIDTREEHVANANAAGFCDIEIRNVTANMRKSLQRLYFLSLAGVPIGQMLQKLRLRSDVQHGNAIGSNRQYRALKRGLWFYAFISAVKR